MANKIKEIRVIFISYNHLDDLFVDKIANILKIRFGEDSIFYDGWSIKPGDKIIAKMNEGLAATDIFFFFMSKNSLKSYMVQAEWGSALMLQATGKLGKFIPIKLDDCIVPPLLTQIKYIDFNALGFDIGLKQLNDSIDSTKAAIQHLDFQNIKGEVKKITEKKYELIITTIIYEPHVRLFFLQKTNKKDVKYSLKGIGFYTGGSIEVPINHEMHTMQNMLIPNGVGPRFPVTVIIEFDNITGLQEILIEAEYNKIAKFPIKNITELVISPECPECFKYNLG
jgi:hypothetical protein